HARIGSPGRLQARAVPQLATRGSARDASAHGERPGGVACVRRRGARHWSIAGISVSSGPCNGAIEAGPNGLVVAAGRVAIRDLSRDARRGYARAALRRFSRGKHRPGARALLEFRPRIRIRGDSMYQAPVRDLRFVLHELLDTARLGGTEGFPDYSPELADSVLTEAARFAEQVLEPLNQSGDREGSKWTA